jgi:hypothetical protein
MMPIKVSEHHCDPLHRLAGGCKNADKVIRPYRPNVFATDVVSAVSRAGGWMHDQAARGRAAAHLLRLRRADDDYEEALRWHLWPTKSES